MIAPMLIEGFLHVKPDDSSQLYVLYNDETEGFDVEEGKIPIPKVLADLRCP